MTHIDCDCWDCERRRGQVAERESVIASLRAMATFLRKHPDVPADELSGSEAVRYCLIGDDLSAIAHINEVAKVLKVEPVLEERSDGGSTYRATRKFGPFAYTIFHIVHRPDTIRVDAQRAYEIEAPAPAPSSGPPELPPADSGRLALPAGGAR